MVVLSIQRNSRNCLTWLAVYKLLHFLLVQHGLIAFHTHESILIFCWSNWSSVLNLFFFTFPLLGWRFGFIRTVYCNRLSIGRGRRERLQVVTVISSGRDLIDCVNIKMPPKKGGSDSPSKKQVNVQDYQPKEIEKYFLGSAWVLASECYPHAQIREIKPAGLYKMKTQLLEKGWNGVT